VNGIEVTLRLRCHEHECAAVAEFASYAPSVAVMDAERVGWSVLTHDPERRADGRGINGPQNLLTVDGPVALCSKHANGEKTVQDISEGPADHVADCRTCGADSTGTRDQCEDWAEDHECKPDVVVRKEKARKRAPR
jgi:hypothetical protein